MDPALDAAGVDRSEVYVTNVVEHFRFEERAKLRLHKKPTRGQIEACRPWLDAELDDVAPSIISCLGGAGSPSGRESV